MKKARNTPGQLGPLKAKPALSPSNKPSNSATNGRASPIETRTKSTPTTKISTPMGGTGPGYSVSNLSSPWKSTRKSTGLTDKLNSPRGTSHGVALKAVNHVSMSSNEAKHAASPCRIASSTGSGSVVKEGLSPRRSSLIADKRGVSPSRSNPIGVKTPGKRGTSPCRGSSNGVNTVDKVDASPRQATSIGMRSTEKRGVSPCRVNSNGVKTIVKRGLSPGRINSRAGLQEEGNLTEVKGQVTSKSPRSRSSDRAAKKLNIPNFINVSAKSKAGEPLRLSRPMAGKTSMMRKDTEERIVAWTESLPECVGQPGNSLELSQMPLQGSETLTEEGEVQFTAEHITSQQLDATDAWVNESAEHSLSQHLDGCEGVVSESLCDTDASFSSEVVLVSEVLNSSGTSLSLSPISSLTDPSTVTQNKLIRQQPAKIKPDPKPAAKGKTSSTKLMPTPKPSGSVPTSAKSKSLVSSPQGSSELSGSLSTRRSSTPKVLSRSNSSNSTKKNMRQSAESKSVKTSKSDCSDVQVVPPPVGSVEKHRREGFPEHIQFAEFRKKFEILLPAEHKPASGVRDEKQAAEDLLKHLDVDPATFRLGLSQVFFRSGGLAQLEDAREEKITGFITRLQAQCRGYLGKEKLKKLVVQHKAVSCLQRNIRLFMAIRGWPWWRLYVKVKPLLNVHRTEEELRDREAELEMLKIKLAKAEKERGEYKQNMDKMDSKLSEISADLVDEHSASHQASELLERETSDRLRLDKELKELMGKHSALQRRHEQTETELMNTRMLAAALDAEMDEVDGDGGDSIYRMRYEKARRESEMMKQQLQRENQEDVERLENARRHTDRKLTEAQDEVEEQRRHVISGKRKCQRFQQDLADTKLHLEEALARNNDLEKKQRKFDAEIHKGGDLLKDERALREKLQRERDQLAAEKYSTEQQLKNVELDSELQLARIKRLEEELQDITTTNKDDKELVQLKRAKNELDRTIQDQQEELDEQAGTIQQLEQSKLRLEMLQERTKQQHTRELDEKEQDIEELRASNQKKVRAIEAQLEEDYAEKQSLGKEKRELERKLQEMADFTPARDTGKEKRLRRELCHTRALLTDAQTVLDKQKDGAANKAIIRQLRNQLEDAEFAAAAAVKARKGTEMEIQDLQQQLDDLSKSKQECEDRYLQLGRERAELQTEIEDHDEDTSELMRKYRAAVQQNGLDSQRIMDQSQQIEDLQRQNAALKEELAALNTCLDGMKESHVDKEVVLRLETKVRELETKLDLETTVRQRTETQLSRAKEQVEKQSDEQSQLMSSSQRHQEEAKRHQRQLRDVQEELSDLQRKESESSQRKHDLEMKLEMLESEVEQGQADLRLAFKRISDLQAAMEEDQVSDSDDEEYGSDSMDDSESDLEDDMPPRRIHNASYAMATRLSSTGSSISSSPRHHTPSGDSDLHSGTQETQER